MPENTKKEAEKVTDRDRARLQKYYDYIRDYNKRNYAAIDIKIRPEVRDVITKGAADAGLSVTQYIVSKCMDTANMYPILLRETTEETDLEFDSKTECRLLCNWLKKHNIDFVNPRGTTRIRSKINSDDLKAAARALAEGNAAGKDKKQSEA